MVSPRITVIPSYENRDAIRAFVRSSLALRPDVEEMLAASEPARLVVVKPNWIQASHEFRPDVWEPVMTHPAVLLSIIEVLGEMMAGRGTIALCDAPNTYADFPAIARRGDLDRKLHGLRARWPDLNLELIDLRREVWLREEEVVVERRKNPEDPRGYARLDLGRDSLFYGCRGEGRYYGADYDARVVNEHHRGEMQEYLLAGTPIACDLFVNVPKLKVHKKTGITCCLKNLVGINGDKNWLPHFVKFGPERGGDEYPRHDVVTAVETYIKMVGQRVALQLPRLGPFLYRKVRNTGMKLLGDSENTLRNGNWIGNDTTWRMALDLNRALLYGNLDGSWRGALAAKKYVAFVDGIVGGQGSGPLCPDPADSRVMAFGDNPAVVDAVAARLIGFEPRGLPIIRGAFEEHRWPIADRPFDAIEVDDERVGARVALDEVEPAIQGGFQPHFGWVEIQRTRQAA